MSKDNKTTTRSVCLFGLSADPPTGTGGHVGMVQALVGHLLNEEHAVDDNHPALKPSPPQHLLYILPVYRHTFSDKRSRLLPFEDRLAMSRLAFQDFTEQNAAAENSRTPAVVVEVSDAERHAFDWAIQNKSREEQDEAAISFGTATLLDYLQSTAAAADSDTIVDDEEDNIATTRAITTRYSLALGADTFCDLVQGKWKESQRVLQQVDKLYVFARKGAMKESDTASSVSSSAATLLHECLAETDRAVLLEVDHLQDVSSSKARLCTNVNELREIVPDPVVDYILEHGLYALGQKRSDDDPCST